MYYSFSYNNMFVVQHRKELLLIIIDEKAITVMIITQRPRFAVLRMQRRKSQTLAKIKIDNYAIHRASSHGTAPLGGLFHVFMN